MEFRRIRYFLAIAEEGSMSRASVHLGIAQPALSRQMRVLEDELGTTLFNRSGRGMRLTPQGETLRRAIKGPMRQLDLAFDDVRYLAGASEVSIVFGMVPELIDFLALPFIHAFSEALPAAKLKFVEKDSEQLIESLLKAEVDFALIYGHAPDERLYDAALISEELVLVGSADAGLSPQSPIRFGDLASFPLVLPSLQRGARSVTDKLAARENVRLTIRSEVDSLGALKKLLKRDGAYSIMPLSAICDDLGKGELTFTRIQEPTPKVVVVAVGRPHYEMARSAMLKTAEIVRRVANDLVAEGRWKGEILF